MVFHGLGRFDPDLGPRRQNFQSGRFWCDVGALSGDVGAKIGVIGAKSSTTGGSISRPKPVRTERRRCQPDTRYARFFPVAKKYNRARFYVVRHDQRRGQRLGQYADVDAWFIETWRRWRRSRRRARK